MRKEMGPLKKKLAQHITAYIERQRLTQNEAARLMRDAPSQISLVMTGKLRGFSTDRLFSMAMALGDDVVIALKPRKGVRKGRGKLILKA